MGQLEQILALFLTGVLLAAAARRVGAPYPVFLAVGGAILAFVPGTPRLNIPPDLVLALFVAPVLLDAAFDTSLRDLRDNWVPVTALAVFAVIATTFAVAVVVRALVPGIIWPAAAALGAIVSPPDAVAASAVLRPLRPPQRILTILEGESLLNDASALLIYRLCLAAVAGSGSALDSLAPTFLVAVLGSLVAGPVLGWLVQRLLERVEDIPTAIILQFISTFTVWLIADQAGLSGVLTTVCFAMTLARTAPARISARIRIPTNAVWATAIFAINLFAFIFIGLQVRPILSGLAGPVLREHLLVAGSVLATVIIVRMIWHMSYNALARWRDQRFGFHPPRPMLRATVGSGLVISWAGMRGIVTLAAALALPNMFPMRDLIVLTAFAVVLGTLVIQGLTLKPLLRLLKLEDGDPVASETLEARRLLLEAAFADWPASGATTAQEWVRKDFKIRLGRAASTQTKWQAFGAEYAVTYKAALAAARQKLLAIRSDDGIGDDAFHALENELDWMEMAEHLRGAGGE